MDLFASLFFRSGNTPDLLFLGALNKKNSDTASCARVLFARLIRSIALHHGIDICLHFAGRLDVEFFDKNLGDVG